MFKKLLLLFFYATVSGTHLYGASSSQKSMRYLRLDPKFLAGELTVEVEKVSASEFSREDFVFLKTVFPDIVSPFEFFTMFFSVHKNYFLFKIFQPGHDKDEKNYLGLSILEPSIIENKLLIEISWIGIHENFRNRGIGKAFMHHIEKHTQADILGVTPHNKSLIPFYTALGFSQLTTKEEFEKYQQNPYVKFCAKESH